MEFRSDADRRSAQLWWGDVALLGPLVVSGAIAVTAPWFERALLNFGRNDGVARELFAHFGAPDGLVRPHTELVGQGVATRHPAGGPPAG
jgi:hypothetical protein